MSSRSWFLRQFRSSSFDADSEKRLVAPGKFEGFQLKYKNFGKKNNPAHRTWRLYPPAPTIQIVIKLQVEAYLSRAVANPNSSKASLSQPLTSVKMLADLPMGINAIR